MIKTRLTEMLGIEYPIIQGSMQYMSLAELASEVSNAGGLGLVPSMAFPDTESLRAEIRKMRTLTDKPFGFNISLVPEVVVPEVIFDYIDVLIEEEVPVIETSGQRPAKFIEPIKKAGIPIMRDIRFIRNKPLIKKKRKFTGRMASLSCLTGAPVSIWTTGTGNRRENMIGQIYQKSPSVRFPSRWKAEAKLR